MAMQLLMHVGSDAQERQAEATALGRLAEQFRADVHACDTFDLPGPSRLRLKPDDRIAIEYEAKGGRIVRAEAVGAEPGHHESYELGRHDAAVFERRDDGPRRFLALIVNRKAGPGSTEPNHPMEILALIGKDQPVPSPEKGEPK